MIPDRLHAAGRDELIDSLLDGALTHEDSRAAYETLRQDPAACEDLARTRYAIARLSTPVDAPDLTHAILGRVQRRRHFIPARMQRMVTAGRVAVAAGAVVTIGLASFVQRAAPNVRIAEDREAPVSRVVASSGLTEAEQPQILAETVETIQSSLASPVARLSLSPAFRPEDGLRFGVSTPEAPAARGRTYLDAQAPGAPYAPLMASEYSPGASPFLLRFEPLLVILSDPHPPIDEDRPRVDER
jgi:hypothetical protein